jgi:hypothetical protein
MEMCTLTTPPCDALALYCTVLHCTVLYCIVLCCIVLYCTALYCIVRYPRDQKKLDLLNRLDLLQSGASSSSSSSGLLGDAAQQFITPTFIRGAWLDQEATPLHEVWCFWYLHFSSCSHLQPAAL